MNPWAPYHTDTVYVRSQTGYGAKGDPVLGDLRTIKCERQQQRNEVMTGAGRIITTTDWFVTGEEIVATDRVYLPGDDTDKKGRAIAKVEPTSQLDGTVTLYEVYL